MFSNDVKNALLKVQDNGGIWPANDLDSLGPPDTVDFLKENQYLAPGDGINLIPGGNGLSNITFYKITEKGKSELEHRLSLDKSEFTKSLLTWIKILSALLGIVGLVLSIYFRFLSN